MRAVGIAFKKLRRGKFLHSTLEALNKLLSYAEWAPTLILMALNNRRGLRVQPVRMGEAWASVRQGPS